MRRRWITTCWWKLYYNFGWKITSQIASLSNIANGLYWFKHSIVAKLRYFDLDLRIKKQQWKIVSELCTSLEIASQGKLLNDLLIKYANFCNNWWLYKRVPKSLTCSSLTAIQELQKKKVCTLFQLRNFQPIAFVCFHFKNR